MANDAWLSELLRRSALTDAGVAHELAATLATEHPSVDAHGDVTHALLTALEETWERGWQPADVVHAVRREATADSVPLVVALIGEHARRSDALHRAPDAWVEQLSELGALDAGDPAVVDAWRCTARLAPVEAWRIVLRLAGALQSTLRIDALLPPPSSWGPRRTRGAEQAPGSDDRALRRIRGLLTKAESTDFPDEAESLTAKAQELMTRYAIDVTLLGAQPATTEGSAVETSRVHVQDPYVRAKMQLLASVAEANGVRVVWYSNVGIANLVGVRADVTAVELLFTSLLLQVANALSAAERPLGLRSASRSFRRSFLLGYSHRIGERLQSARRTATAAAAAEHGVDLLPVLSSRQVAVENRVAELFPRARTTRRRASVDAGGWFAGRAAAERADVGLRRSSLR